MDDFCRGIPKAELHLHIEGTLEPEHMFSLARRNGVEIAYESPEQLRAAYDFADLQSFLDLYYAGCSVLLVEQDFYDLTWAYAQRAAADNVRHAEIFFDPQSHTERGVPFSTVVSGISRALADAHAQLGMSSQLIMCFLRHLPAEAAEKTLDEALQHKQHIAAVGLDSGEAGNPPAKFQAVFQRALEAGFRTVAHAGEEGPAENIHSALRDLRVSRVDHGVRCLEDEAVVRELVERRTPLTVCPLSNRRLKVFERYFGGRNVVRDLVDRGLVVTLNSDDPAYFGGYVGENYAVAARECAFSEEEIAQLARNSFSAAFLGEEARAAFVEEVDAYCRAFGDDDDDGDHDDSALPPLGDDVELVRTDTTDDPARLLFPVRERCIPRETGGDENAWVHARVGELLAQAAALEPVGEPDERALRRAQVHPKSAEWTALQPRLMRYLSQFPFSPERHQSQLVSEPMERMFRKRVHNLAEAMHLDTESAGHGRGRYIQVARPLSLVSVADKRVYARVVDRRYLCVESPLVDHVASAPTRIVDKDDRARRKHRDGVHHHITIVNRLDLEQIASSRGLEPRDCDDLLGDLVEQFAAQVPNCWQPKGIGRVTDEIGNTAHFVVVKWPDANEFRKSLGLEPADFHITIGFSKHDIHNVPKDESAIVPEPNEDEEDVE